MEDNEFYTDADVVIEQLWLNTIDILKETYEYEGIDLGETNNKPDYYNYLKDNPLKFVKYVPGGSLIDSDFEGAGAGKEEIPPGFYSDQVLYEFISRAEGKIGVQWVGTYKGHDIVPSAACFGYDFPGGVHDPSYIQKLGLTQSDAQGLGIASGGRGPIGAESYGGKVKWGWYTNPIPSSHPYWKKLIPYYRDAMIWAWHQPIIQNVKEPAERLARMHSINWWGHHYLKGFSGGSGWNHRYQAAQEACAGMNMFA